MISCPVCSRTPSASGCPCGTLETIRRDGAVRTVVLRARGVGIVHAEAAGFVTFFGPDGNVIWDAPGDAEAWVRSFGPAALAWQVLGS